MSSSIVGGLSEFEGAGKSMGVLSKAVQLSPGELQMRFDFRNIGRAVLAAYETTQQVALEWQPRPSSINFSLMSGKASLLFEGKERAPHSVVMYVEPGVSTWAGRIVESGRFPSNHPIYHVSLPLEDRTALGLPQSGPHRFWCELPVSRRAAAEFAAWAHLRLVSKSEPKDRLEAELHFTLRALLSPALRKDPVLHAPSHYMRIVVAVSNLLDTYQQQPWLVTDLAEHLNVSVRTLQRTYRALFGIGVTQFLRNRTNWYF